jgi:hypothetical protein
MSDNEQTPPDPPVFDFDSYPPDTLFHDRRSGRDRRADREAVRSTSGGERRNRKDRRRRVDPTTFEKQYSSEEMEFMTAMQDFKMRTGKTFPTYGEVLQVAQRLGYRRTGSPRPIADLSESAQITDSA